MNTLSKRHIKVRKMHSLSSERSRTVQAKRNTIIRNAQRNIKLAMQTLGETNYLNGPMG